MRTALFAIFACGVLVSTMPAMADDNCDNGYTTANLNRSDLVKIKSQVNAMVAALGSAPTPYAKESENWQLPTYACRGKAGYRSINTSYSLSLTTDAQQKKLAAEYQKKILAAEASGDMQAVMQVTQQMQKAVLQQDTTNQANTPINIQIDTNNDDSGTIDPGAVLRDGRGFVALRQSGDISSGTEAINIYFDKEALKDAHEAASFDESGNFVVPGRLDVINARIKLSGPKALVEAMVKKFDAGKVLGQLSEKRTKLQD